MKGKDKDKDKDKDNTGQQARTRQERTRKAKKEKIMKGRGIDRKGREIQANDKGKEEKRKGKKG